MELSELHYLVCVFLSLSGITTDVILLALLGTMKKRLLKRPTNKYLFSLILSDLLNAIAYLGCEINSLKNKSVMDESLDAFMKIQLPLIGFRLTSLILSLDNLIALTVDRLVAIKWPLFYDRFATPKHVTMIIVAAWSVGAAWLCSWVTLLKFDIAASYHMASITIIAQIVSGIFVLGFSNMYVYLEARKQIRKIARFSVGKKEHVALRRSLEQEVRAAKICFGLTFCFIFIWLPSLVNEAYRYASQMIIVLQVVSSIVLQLTSIVDPLLYALLNKEFRREFRKLIKGKRQATNTSITILRSSK